MIISLIRLIVLLCLMFLPPAVVAGELKFKLHQIDRPGGGKYGQTSLVDMDGDGDLDFISGSRGSNVWWFEYRAADDWVRHRIGVDAKTDVGGVAFDANGDGLIDQVSGSTLYLNTGTKINRAAKFQRHSLNTISTHDNRVTDIDGDGKPDLLSMSDSAGLFWYKIPKNPRHKWKAHRLGDARHSGLATGDIDGDGDTDVVRADWWFENLDGKGTKWRTHKNIPFAGRKYNRQGMATQNAIGDIDGDGDIDIAITDGEVKGAQAGWVENVDGKGRRWKLHRLATGLGALHSVALADFDNDGDLDMFSCEMDIGGKGRWFIWENPGPKKAGTKWTQHIILSGVHGHESRIGDVDGDGDVDICSKPWNGDRHVYLENLLIIKDQQGKRKRPIELCYWQRTQDGRWTKSITIAREPIRLAAPDNQYYARPGFVVQPYSPSNFVPVAWTCGQTWVKVLRIPVREPSP